MPSPAGAPSSFDGTSAWGYGWRAFTKNLGPFLGMGAIIFVIQAVLAGVGAVLDGGIEQAWDPASGAGDFQLFQSLGSLVGALITLVLSVGLLRMAFDVLDGRKAEFGRMFQGYDVGRAVLTSFVAGLLMAVAFLACGLPILIVGPLLMFAAPAAVDAGLGVGDALGRSVDITKNNVGGAAVLALLYILLSLAMCCTLGLGNIAFTPIAQIALACAYRQATRGRVVEPA